MNNTIFYNNVLNKNSVITSLECQNTVLIDLYAKLSKYVYTIRTLLYEYSKGNFFAVANILTKTVYEKLSYELYRLSASSNKYPDYELLRISYASALEGLYQSILQYYQLVDTRTKLENSTTYELILKDPVKLKEYIKNLKPSTALFEPSVVEVKKAIVKPEYAEYIKLYGFPESGVFEMDKLANILKTFTIQ